MPADDTPPSSPTPAPGPGTHPSASNYLPDLPLAEDLQALLGAGYIVERFLGQGGMGAVYKGLQMPLRRPVAIKILQKREAAGGEDEFAFEERFKREAYAMAALTHPHIVQVYDCGDAGPNYLFISMELVEGGDLSDALKAGQVTPELALKLIPQICDGLQAAHDRGIVHRDIKPANIFLTKDGRAKVADFGLAKKFDAKNTLVTKAGLGMGTPDYAAPEQFDGLEDIDHRADIYSLGVMMYQMLTGRLPRGATFKMPSQLVGVDPRIDAVIGRAMESEREDRYQSTAEIKADLARITATASRSSSAPLNTAAIPVIERPATAARPATVTRPPTGRRSVSQPVARPRTGAVSGATAPIPVAQADAGPKKPNFLVIGAVAASVLGAAAFFLMRKPAAPPAETVESDPASMSAPSTTATSPSTTSSTVPTRRSIPWTSAFTTLGDHRLGKNGKAEDKDGWVMPTELFGMSIVPPTVKGEPVKNAGIRARFRSEKTGSPSDVGFQIELRCSPGNYHAGFTSSGRFKFGVYDNGASILGTPIADQPPLTPGEETVLELYVIGTRLVARCDGKFLGSITDSRYASGEGKVRGTFPFRNVEYVVLDGLSEADALRFAGVDAEGRDTAVTFTPGAVAAGEWIKVPPASLQSSNGSVQGDRFVLPADSYAYPRLPDMTNAVIRVKAKGGNDLPRGLQIRQRNFGASTYAWAAVPSSGAPQGMIQVSTGPTADLRKERLGRCESLAPGKESTFEFAAIGDRFIMTVDGRTVVTLQDDRLLKPGRMALFSGRGEVEFRDLEVLPLDGLSEDRYPDSTKDALAAARTSPTNANATSSPTATAPAATGAAAGFPPGQWVKSPRKFEDLPEVHRKSGTVKFEDGWFKATDVTKGFGFSVPGFKAANMAIRAVMRNPGANPGSGPVLQVRVHNSDRSRYEMMPSDQSLALSHLKEPTRTPLAKGTRRVFITPDRDIPIEMAIVGNRIYGRGDGALVVHGTDDRLASGIAGVHSKAWLRDIEVMNLDGVPEAEALRLIGVDDKGSDLRLPEAEKFVPGQWTKIYTQADQLPPDVRLPTSGATWDDGWIHYEKSTRLYMPASLMGNYGVRARFHRISTKSTAIMTLRNITLTTVDHYRLSNGGGNQFVCGVTRNNQTVPLFKSSVPAPVDSGVEYTMEFGVVGNRLVGRLNDSLVKMASDDEFKSGHAYITGSESTRDVEVISLDGLPEAEALRLLGVDEAGNDIRPQERQRIARAKLMEAVAAIPELKQLHDQFLALQAERVTTPFEAGLASLNAGYLGGLERSLAEAKAAGRADDVTALEAEKLLITSGQSPPRQDDEKTGETLKNLRGIYRGSLAPLEATRESSLKALTDPLEARISALAADFTAKGREADAKVAQEYVQDLNAPEPGAAPATVEVATPTPVLPAATVDESPLRTFPPGDPQKAAEWVLSVGGWMDIEERGTRRTIRSLNDLPKGRFDIHKVWFDKNKPASPPTAEFTTLEPLAGLKTLQYIESRGHNVVDSDTDVLASLPTLTSCTITDAKRFTGQRLSLLRKAAFEGLNFSNCGINRAGLEAIVSFKTLTRLDLSNVSTLTDDDLALLADMKDLQSLILRATTFTEKGLRHLHRLEGVTEFGWNFRPGSAAEDAKLIGRLFPRLKSLIMELGAGPSGAEVSAALASIPNLERLQAGGGGKLGDDIGRAIAGASSLKSVYFTANSNFTDVTYEALAAHKHIESVHIDRTSALTRSAVMALTDMKFLKRLDIDGNSQIGEDAIAEFKKKRPDVSLIR